MSVDRIITLNRIRKELSSCDEFAEKFGWVISEIDGTNQTFTVNMTSPVDNEKYIIEIKFDNYPEIPLLLEFIDYRTNEKGTKQAYPFKKGDSFFHGHPCICNPCSRKSYKEFDPRAPHHDWQLIGWQSNPKVGTLKNVRAILSAIYFRLSNPVFYDKRMA